MSWADALSFVQIVGYVAGIVYIGCHLFTDEVRFKQFMALSCILWATHYSLLGG